LTHARLGADHDNSPYTQTGERIARIAAGGIPLVIDELRTDVTKARKDAQPRVDSGEWLGIITRDSRRASRCQVGGSVRARCCPGLRVVARSARCRVHILRLTGLAAGRRFACGHCPTG
jgi:hypothetical protein